MAAVPHRGGEDSERSAVKRCFSPGSGTNLREDVKRNRSRKHKADPLLLVLQRGVLRREGEELARIHTETDSDLIGSFGKTSSGGGTVVEVEWKRHNSLPTPTLAMVETEILGSLDSHSADLGTPLDWLLTSSCLWSRTCSSNSRLSPSQSLSSPRLSTDLEGARMPLSSFSRQASLCSFSSSYTSWTQPVVGRQQSDSCVPASSILDMPEDLAECGNRSRSRSPRLPPRQRDRSADTSKDISEIDDFELDALEDQFDIELPHDDDERNKDYPWKVVSPDLAYSSMDPSRHSGDRKPEP